MSPERHLKSLKILVVSMGILLVVGFFITLAGAWIKFKAGSDVRTGGCTDVTIDVKGRGKLIEKSFRDDQLILIFKSAEGSTDIVRIDSCSGKMLNSLKILTD